MVDSFISSNRLEYLGPQQFVKTLLATFVIHLLMIYGWNLLPNTKIIDIPVRALNIRLGDGDEQSQDELLTDNSIAQPKTTNSSAIEDVIGKSIRKVEKVQKKIVTKEKAPEKTIEEDLLSLAATNQKKNIPKQFVRENTVNESEKKIGPLLGNSTADVAVIKANYEQRISLWITKFKLYPESAKEQFMQGNIIVRIRIDRRGNIRYSDIEQASDYEELNKAALDMVRRANPVPAIPDNYPDGEVFEFLIPVKYEL